MTTGTFLALVFLGLWMWGWSYTLNQIVFFPNTSRYKQTKTILLMLLIWPIIFYVHMNNTKGYNDDED
jgi:hypothetical protein